MQLASVIEFSWSRDERIIISAKFEILVNSYVKCDGKRYVRDDSTHLYSDLPLQQGDVVISESEQMNAVDTFIILSLYCLAITSLKKITNRPIKTLLTVSSLTGTPVK